MSASYVLSTVLGAQDYSGDKANNIPACFYGVYILVELSKEI